MNDELAHAHRYNCCNFLPGTTPEIVMNVLLECFRELQLNKVATTPSRNSSNHNIPGKIFHEILQIPKLVTEWTG